MQDVCIKASRLVDASHGTRGDTDVDGLPQDITAIGLALDVRTPGSLRPASAKDSKGGGGDPSLEPGTAEW